MKKPVSLLPLLFGILFFVVNVSCVTMDNGANWMYADFSAYDKNYNEFDTSLIIIGMPESELQEAMGISSSVSAAGPNYHVLQFEKWRSVPGPDYLEKMLFVKILDGVVAEFRVINDVAVTNPW